MHTTAIHEAAHAVLLVALHLECKNVTIVPDISDMSAGSVTDGGSAPTQGSPAAKLYEVARETYYFRRATVFYAGAEALDRVGYRDHTSEGAQSRRGTDEYNAVDNINAITDDEESIDLLFKLAQRRSVVLVEHYWPEIEAVAEALTEKQNLQGDDVLKIFTESIIRRKGARWVW